MAVRESSDQQARVTRLGVFGGTFDPVHLGHLIVAETARAEAQLQRVLFVLSPRPPHKNPQELSLASHRLEMLRLALADHSGFSVSALELQRQGTSYTVDTLRQLHSMPEHAEADLHLIVGMDSLATLAEWRDPETIIQLARLLVYPRLDADPRVLRPEFQQSYRLLDSPIVEISSSEIRRRVQRGGTIRYLVPETVQRYIETNRLYR